MSALRGSGKGMAGSIDSPPKHDAAKSVRETLRDRSALTRFADSI
jgi:hypothetical protein